MSSYTNWRQFKDSQSPLRWARWEERGYVSLEAWVKVPLEPRLQQWTGCVGVPPPLITGLSWWGFVECPKVWRKRLAFPAQALQSEDWFQLLPSAWPLIALNIPAYRAVIKTPCRPDCRMESKSDQTWRSKPFPSAASAPGGHCEVCGQVWLGTAAPGVGVSHLVGTRSDVGQPSTPSVRTEPGRGRSLPLHSLWQVWEISRGIFPPKSFYPLHLAIPPIKESPELGSTSHSISFLTAKSEVPGIIHSPWESVQTAYLPDSLERERQFNKNSEAGGVCGQCFGGRGIEGQGMTEGSHNHEW